MLRLIWLELTKRRNALLGWGLALGGYAALILGIAPSLAEQMSDFDLSGIAAYEAMGINGAIDSASGLIAMYMPFFGLMLAVYGMITGTNALAGEEDRGTLEMLLAAPKARWQIVVAKAIAIEIVLALLCLFTFVGYMIVWPSVSAEIGTGLTTQQLFEASFEMWPLAFFFAMLGLFLGAYLPRRPHALGFGLAVLIGTYLLNNLGGQVNALESILPFQPFYHYTGSALFTKGIDWYKVANLTIAGLITALIAIQSFRRRNVTVGAWPWQRAKVLKA